MSLKLIIEKIFTENDLQAKAPTQLQENHLVDYLLIVQQEISKICAKENEASTFTNKYVARGMGLITGERYRKTTFYVYPNSTKNKLNEIIISLKGPYNTYGKTTVSFAGKPKNLPPRRGSIFEECKKLALKTTAQNSFFKTISLDFGYFNKLQENGGEIPIKVILEPDRAKIMFIPNHTGVHELCLSTEGFHLRGSPFNIQIMENTTGILDSFEQTDKVVKRSKTIIRKLKSKIIDFVNEKVSYEEYQRSVRAPLVKNASIKIFLNDQQIESKDEHQVQNHQKYNKTLDENPGDQEDFEDFPKLKVYEIQEFQTEQECKEVQMILSGKKNVEELNENAVNEKRYKIKVQNKQQNTIREIPAKLESLMKVQKAIALFEDPNQSKKNDLNKLKARHELEGLKCSTGIGSQLELFKTLENSNPESPKKVSNPGWNSNKDEFSKAANVNEEFPIKNPIKRKVSKQNSFSSENFLGKNSKQEFSFDGIESLEKTSTPNVSSNKKFLDRNSKREEFSFEFGTKESAEQTISRSEQFIERITNEESANDQVSNENLNIGASVLDKSRSGNSKKKFLNCETVKQEASGITKAKDSLPKTQDKEENLGNKQFGITENAKPLIESDIHSSKRSNEEATSEEVAKHKNANVTLEKIADQKETSRKCIKEKPDEIKLTEIQSGTTQTESCPVEKLPRRRKSSRESKQVDLDHPKVDQQSQIENPSKIVPIINIDEASANLNDPEENLDVKANLSNTIQTLIKDENMLERERYKRDHSPVRAFEVSKSLWTNLELIKNSKINEDLINRIKQAQNVDEKIDKEDKIEDEALTKINIKSKHTLVRSESLEKTKFNGMYKNADHQRNEDLMHKNDVHEINEYVLHKNEDETESKQLPIIPKKNITNHISNKLEINQTTRTKDPQNIKAKENAKTENKIGSIENKKYENSFKESECKLEISKRNKGSSKIDCVKTSDPSQTDSIPCRPERKLKVKKKLEGSEVQKNAKSNADLPIDSRSALLEQIRAGRRQKIIINEAGRIVRTESLESEQNLDSEEDLEKETTHIGKVLNSKSEQEVLTTRKESKILDSKEKLDKKLTDESNRNICTDEKISTDESNIDKKIFNDLNQKPNHQSKITEQTETNFHNLDEINNDDQNILTKVDANKLQINSNSKPKSHTLVSRSKSCELLDSDSKFQVPKRKPLRKLTLTPDSFNFAANPNFINLSVKERRKLIEGNCEAESKPKDSIKGSSEGLYKINLMSPSVKERKLKIEQKQASQSSSSREDSPDIDLKYDFENNYNAAKEMILDDRVPEDYFENKPAKREFSKSLENVAFSGFKLSVSPEKSLIETSLNVPLKPSLKPSISSPFPNETSAKDLTDKLEVVNMIKSSEDFADKNSLEGFANSSEGFANPSECFANFSEEFSQENSSLNNNNTPEEVSTGTPSYSMNDSSLADVSSFLETPSASELSSLNSSPRKLFQKDFSPEEDFGFEEIESSLTPDLLSCHVELNSGKARKHPDFITNLERFASSHSSSFDSNQSVSLEKTDFEHVNSELTDYIKTQSDNSQLNLNSEKLDFTSHTNSTDLKKPLEHDSTDLRIYSSLTNSSSLVKSANSNFSNLEKPKDLEIMNSLGFCKPTLDLSDSEQSVSDSGKSSLSSIKCSLSTDKCLSSENILLDAEFSSLNSEISSLTSNYETPKKNLENSFLGFEEAFLDSEKSSNPTWDPEGCSKSGKSSSASLTPSTSESLLDSEKSSLDFAKSMLYEEFADSSHPVVFQSFTSPILSSDIAKEVSGNNGNFSKFSQNLPSGDSDEALAKKRKCWKRESALDIPEKQEAPQFSFSVKDPLKPNFHTEFKLQDTSKFPEECEDLAKQQKTEPRESSKPLDSKDTNLRILGLLDCLKQNTEPKVSNFNSNYENEDEQLTMSLPNLSYNYETHPNYSQSLPTKSKIASERNKHRNLQKTTSLISIDDIRPIKEVFRKRKQFWDSLSSSSLSLHDSSSRSKSLEGSPVRRKLPLSRLGSFSLSRESNSSEMKGINMDCSYSHSKGIENVERSPVIDSCSPIMEDQNFKSLEFLPQEQSSRKMPLRFTQSASDLTHEYRKSTNRKFYQQRYKTISSNLDFPSIHDKRVIFASTPHSLNNESKINLEPIVNESPIDENGSSNPLSSLKEMYNAVPIKDRIKQFDKKSESSSNLRMPGKNLNGKTYHSMSLKKFSELKDVERIYVYNDGKKSSKFNDEKAFREFNVRSSLKLAVEEINVKISSKPSDVAISSESNGVERLSKFDGVNDVIRSSVSSDIRRSLESEDFKLESKEFKVSLARNFGHSKDLKTSHELANISTKSFKAAKQFFENLEQRSEILQFLSKFQLVPLVRRATKARTRRHSLEDRPKKKPMLKRGGSLRISDRFYVRNLYKDVIGDRRSSFKGRPNQSASAMALNSMPKNWDAMDTNELKTLDFSIFDSAKLVPKQTTKKSTYGIYY